MDGLAEADTFLTDTSEKGVHACSIVHGASTEPSQCFQRMMQKKSSVPIQGPEPTGEMT